MNSVVNEGLQPVPNHVRAFCRFMDTEINACRVVHLDISGIPRFSEIQKAVGNNTSADTTIVFIDSGKRSAAGKLFSLLMRNYTVKMVARAMNQQGCDKSTSYALYPSADRVTFVYERHTAAARYAESMLLTTSNNAIVRCIHKLFSQSSLGAPSVELVAIVGRQT